MRNNVVAGTMTCYWTQRSSHPMALFKTRSAAVYGIDAHLIVVEVDMYLFGSARDPRIAGMLDVAVCATREGRGHRLRSTGGAGDSWRDGRGAHSRPLHPGRRVVAGWHDPTGAWSAIGSRMRPRQGDSQSHRACGERGGSGGCRRREGLWGAAPG